MDGNVARERPGQVSKFRTGFVTNLPRGADGSSTTADASVKYWRFFSPWVVPQTGQRSEKVM
jgi:hypothetical protein